MKMTYKEFFDQLDTEFGISGKITLTKTMLEKHIIDANRTIVKLAMHIGINYSEMQKGEKVTISGRYYNGLTCKVSFYRTRNRGDKRFSITGIKAHASIGDTVAITHDGKGALVINATKAVGDAQ
jgi:RNase P/RNase MRP subunit p29